MVYADDARNASKSAEGLAMVMTVIVTVIVTVVEVTGLTVSQTKTENTLLRTHNQALQTPPLVVEAAG